MRNYYYPLLLLMNWIMASNAYGQMPVKVSLFSEATSVPFDKVITTPIHPGVQLGTDFHWKESKHIKLFPSVNIGYMFHNKLFQGVYINGELGLDYKFSFGLNIKTALGIGYLHTFTTQQEFQFENGRYVSKRDRGNARIMPSFSVGVGYNLKKNESRSAEIFILHQTWLEYPYSPGFIPLMAHTNFHVGSKFYPFNKNNKK
ncbi:hypothetical protein [Fulvivirga lutea]|uniref:Outer membrane protein beta-barrel domain-containing protein n=1 Tax=Fulvivirga lutea TaxID=2810512 RepID=A0A974WG44_9BACT|nr:hypothetical protein [Fulvivirga lutea]QSE97843.1 hypothetical protein JR347_01770 [Fulvivirga lutea]